MKIVALLGLGILGMASLGCEKSQDKPQTQGRRWADTQDDGTQPPARLGSTKGRTKRTQQADWETDSTSQRSARPRADQADSARYKPQSGNSKWRTASDPERAAEQEEDALDAEEDRPEATDDAADGRTFDRSGREIQRP